MNNKIKQLLRHKDFYNVQLGYQLAIGQGYSNADVFDMMGSSIEKEGYINQWIRFKYHSVIMFMSYEEHKFELANVPDRILERKIQKNNFNLYLKTYQEFKGHFINQIFNETK